MDIYIFKVKNYHTVLVGQRREDNSGAVLFYVENAEGRKFQYSSEKVEWFELVYKESNQAV